MKPMKPPACIFCCCAILHIAAKPHEAAAFVPAAPSSSAPPFVTHRRRRSSSLSLLFDGEWQKRKYGQKQSNNSNGVRGRSAAGRFDVLRDEATINALLERVLLGTTTFSSSDSEQGRRLSRLQLLGRGSLSLSARSAKDEESIDASCLFLADASQTAVSGDATVNCLPVPLSDNVSSANRQLKLLSFARAGKPISKSLFLTISPLLTGRDGSLWDNLPWTTWTIDPTRKRLVDAAQNAVLPKFHPGKRDAFERMNGKDWYGRSLSGGNLKARLEYWLEGLDDITLYLESENETEEEAKGGVDTNSGVPDSIPAAAAPKFDEEAASILARRILEVENAEARMAVAEAEQKLAILRGQEEQGDDDDDGSVESSLNEIEARRNDLAEVETALADVENMEQELLNDEDSGVAGVAQSILRDFLAALTSRGDDATPKIPEAPYRGAYGYSAVVDTPEEMFWKSVLPYRSPYDLLLEIISEQLNADVIGAALEDTSIFDSEVILGGAVVLRRRGRPKSITVGGETIEISDDDDDYGSLGVKEGELFIVECDADEAIGLAIAADLDVLVEGDILRTSTVDAIFTGDADVDVSEEDVATVDSIPLMTSSGYTSESWVDQEVPARSSSQPKPQPPKTTDAFLDFFAPKSSGNVYSTDNPIQSLDQYDSLSIQDKGRLLLSLPSFEGQLPRPRVLREYENNKKGNTGRKEKDPEEIADPNPIDNLLVPFIDESIRREYLIRDAEKRGDSDEVNRLREEKSKRLIARERAAMARENGRDEEADLWEQEADLQASMRADVTQDEGEYSRFLDRDDWYERERVARAKRVDKKKFGTLLDGLE